MSFLGHLTRLPDLVTALSSGGVLFLNADSGPCAFVSVVVPSILAGLILSIAIFCGGQEGPGSYIGKNNHKR